MKRSLPVSQAQGLGEGGNAAGRASPPSPDPLAQSDRNIQSDLNSRTDRAELGQPSVLTQLWLALWAPVPFLNWLSLLGVVRLGTLPPALRWLLGGSLALQLLSSVFTPHPLVSLGTGLLRSLLLVGLLITGWGPGSGGLGRARWLLSLLPGLVVVLVTALAYSVLKGGLGELLHARLQHPSYQMVSLGLAAGLTLWLAVYWPVPQGWQGWRGPLRIMVALLALGVLVLGQSRAPLAAALLGLLAAALTGVLRGAAGRRRFWGLGAALLLIGGGASLLSGPLSTSGSHLTQLGLNSRDTYWEEAAGVFRAVPLGGAGVGQLGSAVFSTQDNCFQGGPTYSVGCPGWALRLSEEPWFAPARKLSWLAHNVSLQNLAETGLIGSAGYFLMLGLVVAAAFASRQPLLIALATGYSVVNLFDNSTMLPSLAVSEVFWLAGGVALREVYRLGLWSGASDALRPLALASLWGGALLLISLVPVVLPSLLPASLLPVRGPVPTVLALNAARQGAALGQTTLHLGLGHLEGGLKRLRLELCTPVCGVQRVQDIVPSSGGEWWGGLALPQLTRGQLVKVQVLPPETGLLSARPLGEVVWRQP